MTLHFPVARLFIHDLLADEKLSAAEAMAKAAREYEIVSIDASIPIENSSSCACKTAAKSILLAHFLTMETAPSINLDEIWAAVERELRAYEKSTAQLFGCDQPNPDPCQKCAPILFDLILQQVRRYA